MAIYIYNYFSLYIYIYMADSHNDADAEVLLPHTFHTYLGWSERWPTVPTTWDMCEECGKYAHNTSSTYVAYSSNVEYMPTMCPCNPNMKYCIDIIAIWHICPQYGHIMNTTRYHWNNISKCKTNEHVGYRSINIRKVFNLLTLDRNRFVVHCLCQGVVILETRRPQKPIQLETSQWV